MEYAKAMVQGLLWFEAGRRAYQDAEATAMVSTGQVRQQKLETYQDIINAAHTRVKHLSEKRDDSLSLANRARELLRMAAEVERLLGVEE